MPIRIEQTIGSNNLIGAFYDDDGKKLSSYIPLPVLIAAHNAAGVAADSEREVYNVIGDYLFSALPVVNPAKRKKEVIAVSVSISQYTPDEVVLSHTVAVDQIDTVINSLSQHCPENYSSIYILSYGIKHDLLKRLTVSSNIDKTVTTRDVQTSFTTKELRELGIELAIPAEGSQVRPIGIAQDALTIQVRRDRDGNAVFVPDIIPGGLFPYE